MVELTGRHVLATTVGFFAVVIAVNMTLAYKAVSTFPGLEVDNGYIASQSFDRERAAQLALGWTLRHDYRDGQIILTFTGRDGNPVAPLDLSALVGRTTEAKEDRRPAFRWVGDHYVADVALSPGKWMMNVAARADDGTPFRQRLDLFVER